MQDMSSANIANLASAMPNIEAHLLNWMIDSLFYYVRVIEAVLRPDGILGLAVGRFGVFGHHDCKFHQTFGDFYVRHIFFIGGFRNLTQRG